MSAGAPPRRLLAVAHEATLTGSPMNLLHLLRWVRAETDTEVHTLVLHDGALRHRFEEVGEVTLLDRWAPAALLGTVQAGLVHLGSSRAWKPVAAARLRPQLARLGSFDLVYLNSLPSVQVLPYLRESRAVVAHVHELQVAFQTWDSTSQVQDFRTRPDRWLAASGAVRDLLVDEIGLPPAQVLVHHEFIQARELAARSVSLREIERCRQEYRIPAEASVVVGAGTVDWRKGADLFVQLATEVRRRTRDPVHFVWVGGDLRGADFVRVRSDLERAGADHVHFVGVRPDPVPWFAMADVFALTSREDPFPLVVLESASLGVPIVTYRNGGIPELLTAAGPDAAQGIIDHLDVGAMAAQVLALLGDPVRRAAAADQVRSRVLDAHDVSVAAPRLWADLEALMAESGTRPEPVSGAVSPGIPN